ncbi:flagellar filament capping protein FliD [Photobacterium rosenbergii]|uniref:Flagellar hook-associated protein 2 n=1 Tax=Photobacterium rosenbergii TaxID=294936 RepID=A0ABU3ZKY6_9GAMM|nr:flagellar filament capping protein FliD [Photobacterium rosenbergii]MDV5170771.1 flagellar filament capping protein FliD [Photobacterium rosenbergii]
MSMMDPASMAMQMVMLQRQPFDIQYANQQKMYQAQLDAWKDIDSAFSDFSSALERMNKADSSFVKNSATASEEGYINASASNFARAGSYDLFVKQLATAQQEAFTLQGDELPTDGVITIEVPGNDPIEVDFAVFNADGDKDLHDLADHINEFDEGVSASVVRSGDEVSLVLSSTETGEENAFKVTADQTVTDAFKQQELSKAQDAIVMLGGESGLEIRSSDNTIDDAIYGVTFELTKAHEPGDKPLTLVVGSDETASKEAVQEFVDAYNELVNTIQKHTMTDYKLDQDDDDKSSDGDDDDKDDNSIKITEAGALSSDSTARGLKNMLNTVTRGQFDEGTLHSIGIEANRDGTLKIDNERFEKALQETPEKIDAIFLGDNGVLTALETAISPYTGSANSGTNLLKSRQDSLQGNLDRVDDKIERLDHRMEKTYNRYLREYTAMQQTMSQMQSTSSMFMF